ncbi:hypothetical protein [Flaviaesturariibacter amylovorans]|uniref:Uncharacterized protein n=1 Tax=Flaviaesturariibacter amylovorans TaxID=1084520 RepID=A0ABP8GQC7_9BACT
MSTIQELVSEFEAFALAAIQEYAPAAHESQALGTFSRFGAKVAALNEKFGEYNDALMRRANEILSHHPGLRDGDLTLKDALQQKGYECAAKFRSTHIS